MDTLNKHENGYKLLLLRLVVYGLPFAFFYAIGDLVEELKKPERFYQENIVFRQWLYQNNQDNLMQYLILCLLLTIWGIVYYLLERSFNMDKISGRLIAKEPSTF